MVTIRWSIELIDSLMHAVATLAFNTTDINLLTENKHIDVFVIVCLKINHVDCSRVYLACHPSNQFKCFFFVSFFIFLFAFKGYWSRKLILQVNYRLNVYNTCYTVRIYTSDSAALIGSYSKQTV